LTPGGICEIGVYKGGFLIALLKNLLKLNAVGIDPYPQQDDIRKIFLENLRSNQMVERVQLLPKYNSISQNTFDLIHIDGEHSKAAVLKDLNFAMHNLTKKGVMVVDDIWHPLFPGVISATMKVVHERDFVPFLTTRNKMYLCREAEHEFFFSRAFELIREAKIEFSGGLMQGDDNLGVLATYDQPNLIKGYRQLVVLQKTKFEQLVTLGLITRPSASRTKKIVKELLPPVASSLIRKFSHRKRG
jgi:hypothetical protein